MNTGTYQIGFYFEGFYSVFKRLWTFQTVLSEPQLESSSGNFYQKQNKTPVCVKW